MAYTVLKIRYNLDDEIPPIGQRWYSHFLQRHPTLETRFSRALDNFRAVAITPQLVRSWLNLFKMTLERYSITLYNVWNMDETDIAMGLIGRSKVVISRTTAERYMRQPGNRNWVSILETIGGTGRALAPFFIFQGVLSTI